MSRITETEVENNRQTHIYVYADDKTQRSYRGQAETFNGYGHCFPIYTRIWCCADKAAQYGHIYTPEEYQEELDSLCFERIRLTIQRWPDRTLVVVPKIGEGCSGLKWKFPEHFRVITDFLESIRK